MKQHKHAELIKQWADGAEIECYCRFTSKWFYQPSPTWTALFEYRVKPKVKWTPKYKLEAYEYKNIHFKPVLEENNLSDDVKKYWKLTKFVEEFETDFNERCHMIVKEDEDVYDHVLNRYDSIGTVEMSLDCAKKLCNMLNSGEIEL